MLSKNLFEEVLVQPVESGANKLYVVSGYATAAMAFRHLEALKAKNYQVEIELDVAEMAQFGPYKLWSADLVQCPGCGTKVITGFSRTFVEHWQPGFNQYFDRAKQRG